MKDIYVKFGAAVNGKAIAGESRDTKFQKSIEVTSWQHIIKQPKSATASTAGGHTAERCEHGEMIFTKDLDNTSPVLWEACSAGTTYKEVVISFMRANGTTDRVEYLTIKLKDVVISSVTPSVVTEGLPSEVFGLKYAAVDWTYTEQKIDGQKGATSKGAWSLSKNRAAYES